MGLVDYSKSFIKDKGIVVEHIDHFHCIHPACCEKARRHIQWAVFPGGEGEWFMQLVGEVVITDPPELETVYHCPFCGSKLPEGYL